MCSDGNDVLLIGDMDSNELNNTETANRAEKYGEIVVGRNENRQKGIKTDKRSTKAMDVVWRIKLQKLSRTDNRDKKIGGVKTKRCARRPKKDLPSTDG